MFTIDSNPLMDQYAPFSIYMQVEKNGKVKSLFFHLNLVQPSRLRLARSVLEDRAGDSDNREQQQDRGPSHQPRESYTDRGAHDGLLGFPRAQW